MADLRPTLSETELDALHQLCAEYRTATLAACKLLNVGNPPDSAKVVTLVNAASEVTTIFDRIKQLLHSKQLSGPY